LVSVKVTLQAAGRVEQHGGRGDAAEGRGRGEADQADDEDALAADEVGDASAEQQQAAEGQGVGRDDPLAVGVADVEVALRRGQGDVHDRGVEHDHQLGDRDHAEGEPAPRIGCRCSGHDGPHEEKGWGDCRAAPTRSAPWDILLFRTDRNCSATTATLAT
jgi:hypothetical protein